MKQVIAGVSGVASLALLGYIASRQGHSISKRAIEFDDEVIEIETSNSTLTQQEQWIAFLKELNLDVDQPDIFEKVAQVPYSGNFANMRAYYKDQYASVHDAMINENGNRMEVGGAWAEAFVVQPAAEYKAPADTSGNCEWAPTQDQADDEGCVLRMGLDHLSPHVDALINSHCDADYVPYTDDDNTNLWFMVPRAIPLWAKDEGSHVSDWVEYFTFIKRITKNWWERNHNGIIRLSVGLYMNGVQLIPRGVRMTRRSPLARLTRWYSQPALSAQKPGMYRTLRTLADSMGKGAYVRNSGNGVLSGSEEAKDNCYMLMFIQDIPYDLNTMHIRTEEGSRQRTGDFFDTINKNCFANYAFVMPGARDSSSPAGKFINAFELIAHPEMQQYYPWDPEYSGVYRLESFQEINSQSFEDHVRNSMCMHAKRQQCKLTMKGKEVTPTVAANYDDDYYGDDEYANDYAAYDNSYIAASEAPIEDYAGGMKAVTEAPTEAPEPQPECCGGTLYGGLFNNVKKMCIYDYQTQSNKVITRTADNAAPEYNADNYQDYAYDYKK